MTPPSSPSAPGANGVLAPPAPGGRGSSAEPTGPAPLFHLALRLDGQPCLVVGGGPIGARKAAALLECGAVVTIVSPQTCAQVDELGVRVLRRPYLAGEVAGYRLVVTATGDPEVDREVYLDGERAGVLVNAADDPASCSFLMPAVLRRGDVSIGVSTAGVSPWLAGWVKRLIGEAVGAEVADLAAIVGETRAAVRAAGVSSEGLDWAGLVEGALWPLLQAGDLEPARAAAKRWAGDVLDAGSGAHDSPE